jgi:shikimate dehydrogenase
LKSVDRYCVFGNPIAHSKSPEIHAAFAAQTGQQLQYERRLAPIGGFEGAVREFMAEGGMGANVTVPFKLDACALAQVLTPRAEAAGAVNTLKLSGGEILGDNTDGAGLVADIAGNCGVNMAGKRVLLLGAGGAARGAIFPLLQQQPAELTIANRTVATAQALVHQFTPMAAQGQRLHCREYTALEGPFDIVINATSASLSGDLPPIPVNVFTAGTLALDMMYGKEPTVFLQLAARHGARTRDGLGMLVEQAAEAFYLWRGVRPVTGPVMTQLRAYMQTLQTPPPSPEPGKA